MSNAISYASKILGSAQRNRTTTEKEPFAIGFACDKFRSYLLSYKVIINTDRAAFKLLFRKPQPRRQPLRWMLLI